MKSDLGNSFPDARKMFLSQANNRGRGREGGINTLIIDEGVEMDDESVRFHIFARRWLLLSHFRAQMSSSLGSQFFREKKRATRNIFGQGNAEAEGLKLDSWVTQKLTISQVRFVVNHEGFLF